MTVSTAMPAAGGGMLGAMRRWLETAPAPVFAAYAGAMTFGTYFAMYAFRKPFAVARFTDATPIAGVDYKVVLVIAQVIGYALAKLIGIKVIAELAPGRRIAGILLQVGIAELALVLFGLVPPPWNVAALFLDGLALGMVWGMVFAFVEGRRQSDLIAAILCASLVISSGVMKSVGQWVMLQHLASEWWMPATTGLIFAPLLVFCLCGLATLPPPSPRDIAERTKRVPMDAWARGLMLRRIGPGLAALVAVYVLLTALRDFRDNFAAEIWVDLGMGGQAGIFTLTELPISLVVLAVLATLNRFHDNRRALAANFILVGAGLATAGISSAAFAMHLLGPVVWMTVLGAGLYLAYTPFNGMLFDRLVAAGGTAGTAGYLIYIADSSGYVGSIALLLLRNFVGFHFQSVQFLVAAGIVTGALGLILLLASSVYFQRRLQR